MMSDARTSVWSMYSTDNSHDCVSKQSVVAFVIVCGILGREVFVQSLGDTLVYQKIML